MTNHGPIPPEHEEIARGAGAAAILMFLQIAVIGYLGFLCYYLLWHGPQVFWSLTAFPAWYHYYLPAGFALFSRLPSDPLTDKVSLASLVMGCVATAVYGICLEPHVFGAGVVGAAPVWHTAAAGLLGYGAAAVIRLVFEQLLGSARANYKKNDMENEVSE